MTLIQTVFTNDLIIQVSDRRLTKGPHPIMIDDEKYTKLICWNNTFTAGFTGIARIDRRQKEPTSHWIAKVLSDYSFFEPGVLALRADAERQLKKLPKNWDRRLAIVIAGFDHRAVPLVAVITNFDISTGIALPDPTKFHGTMCGLASGHRVGTHVAGQSLDAVQANLLTRYVRKMVMKQDRINQAVRLMVKIQRLVATDNVRVGADALCVLIPRAQTNPVGLSGVMMTNLGGPELPTNTTSFGFFDSRGWQFEQRSPITAGGGSVGESWSSADPDNPDNQRISFKYLKVPQSWQSP